MPGYLRQLSGFEACVVIIDSFRLRREDECAPYYGSEYRLAAFQDYLNKLQKCGIILPLVWELGLRNMCEQLATEWGNIELEMDGSDIREHYTDDLMRLRIRIIADKVTGKHLQLMRPRSKKAWFGERPDRQHEPKFRIAR